MSAPFVIAVPAKGRLQENAENFFARAGLELIKPRGARDYRGTIAELPEVEVAYLSASEIVDLLAQGAVHFGLTGEDLNAVRAAGVTDDAIAEAALISANFHLINRVMDACGAGPLTGRPLGILRLL